MKGSCVVEWAWSWHQSSGASPCQSSREAVATFFHNDARLTTILRCRPLRILRQRALRHRGLIINPGRVSCSSRPSPEPRRKDAAAQIRAKPEARADTWARISRANQGSYQGQEKGHTRQGETSRIFTCARTASAASHQTYGRPTNSHRQRTTACGPARVGLAIGSRKV